LSNRDEVLHIVPHTSLQNIHLEDVSKRLCYEEQHDDVCYFASNSGIAIDSRKPRDCKIGSETSLSEFGLAVYECHFCPHFSRVVVGKSAFIMAVAGKHHLRAEYFHVNGPIQLELLIRPVL
jgi:hypothetical protein